MKNSDNANKNEMNYNKNERQRKQTDPQYQVRESVLFIGTQFSNLYLHRSLTGYFDFRVVVRNDALVRRLRSQRSRPCAVGR